MIRNLLALTIGISLGVSSGASAEDRPTVFIHGLGSNSHTWDQAVSRLTPLLAMQPFQVDLDWRALYETQAGQLQQQLGGLPDNVVAVGHSNGGRDCAPVEPQSKRRQHHHARLTKSGVRHLSITSSSGSHFSTMCSIAWRM
jgi:hypothetical protein